MRKYRNLVIASTLFLLLTSGIIYATSNNSRGSATDVSISKTVAEVTSGASPTLLKFTEPQTTSPLWGAYTGNTAESISTFESLVGRKMDIVAIFSGWGDEFPSEYAPFAFHRGKTLVIFWEQYGVTLDNIINGKSDGYISQYVADTRLYGGPVILAPFHEMNGNWDPWDGTREGNDPEKIIAAWKHVHDKFQGITNVKFAWTVNSDSVPDTPENSITAYYPGDAYVDYVAVDGFDFDGTQTWESIFAGTLNKLKSFRKPIYILSMASRAGNHKSKWITDALTIEIPRHPEIVGWVWFNENKGGEGGEEENWLVNSDATALAAFKKALSRQGI